MRRATIYSIAQECGVSASTVSRAFSRPDAVRDEVRERIQQVALRMNYEPHITARRLVTGRNNMLGALVPDITNPFFPQLMRAIQSAAETHGSGVLLIDSGETATNEARLIAQVRTQVDGLLIASPRSQAAGLHTARQGLPCVVINRVLRGVPAVVVDDTQSLAEAGAHLKELGHRQVALLSGPAASWAGQHRDRLIKGMAQRLGLELMHIGSFPASFEGGRQAATRLMRTRATATFAFDDAMACGVLAELLRAGRNVPGDMSIVGCDDVLLARMVTPALTTITAPVTDVGYRAVELLGELLDEPDATPRVVRCPSSLTVRTSTAARAGGV